MSKPWQRFADRVPMRPKPTISAVLPDSSIGRPPWRSAQVPLRTIASSARCSLGQRHHQVERMLRDGRGVGGARDHQRHAARGQCRHLDRVVADADARDHLHRGRGIHLGLPVRRAGQRDAGGVRQQRQQFGLRDRRRDRFPPRYRRARCSRSMPSWPIVCGNRTFLRFDAIVYPSWQLGLFRYSCLGGGPQSLIPRSRPCGDLTGHMWK